MTDPTHQFRLPERGPTETEVAEAAEGRMQYAHWIGAHKGEGFEMACPVCNPRDADLAVPARPHEEGGE